MDKNTYGQYGWIVIVVIIICILISTMPGIGMLIKTNIKTTVNSYKATQSDALNGVGDNVGADVDFDTIGRPMIMARNDEKAFWAVLDEVNAIVFEATIYVPDDAVYAWDVSVEGNGADYTVGEDTDGKIIAHLTSDGVLHISANGKMLANYNSAGFFEFFKAASIDFGNYFDTSMVTNMSSLFSECKKLTALNLSTFNTASVTDMSYMFSNCKSATSINVSSFNTKKVVDMNAMFNGCEKLESLNLDNFNTSNVQDMSWMFGNCQSIKALDLTSFNTSNVTSMHDMFIQCYLLESVNFSSFNTSNVKDFSNMFASCRALVELDISTFDTGNARWLSYMFTGATKLSKVLVGSSWTTEGKNINRLFDGCACSSVTLKS